MLEDYIGWLGAGLAAVILFRAGMSFEREQVKERQAKQRQYEHDLAELAYFASQFAVGELTVEEADAKVNASVFCGQSARRLWAGFSLEQKRELGVNAIKLHSDPEYLARQQKLVDGMKAADPEMYARIEKAFSGNKSS